MAAGLIQILLSRELFAEIVFTLAAVVAAGPQATLLKSCVLNRMDIGHCGRVFRTTPYPHAQRGIPA
jgi:hypothetical protein